MFRTEGEGALTSHKRGKEVFDPDRANEYDCQLFFNRVGSCDSDFSFDILRETHLINVGLNIACR